MQSAKRYQGGASKFSNDAEKWIQILNESLEKFYNFMIKTGNVFPKDNFTQIFTQSQPFVIEKCCDFTAKLRSIAEEKGKPILYLTSDDKSDIGTPNGQYQRTMESVRQSYKNMSEGFLRLKKYQ